MIRHDAKRSIDDMLKARLREHPHCAFPTLYAMRRDEGLVRNANCTYRIYTEEPLCVPEK
jgi:hypothetical protein